MALNHEETDRVPIDLGSSRSTGINAIAYKNLKQYLGINTPTTMFDVKQLLALMEDEILQRVGSDVVILPRMAPSLGITIDEYKLGELPQKGGEVYLAKAYDPVTLRDGSLGIYDKKGNLIAKRPKTGLYFDEIYNPLEDAESEEDIDKLDFPSISDQEIIYLKEKAAHLYETTDYAISGATSFSLFEKATKDWGYENILIQMYAEPDLVKYYLDKMADAYIIMMERYLDAVGDYVQIVQTNDDFGSQNGLLMSPEMFREFYKPRLARIIQAIRKKKKNIHIYFHCCGSIYPIIGDLVEIGVDILNPIQIESDNMDPVKIKKEFGRNLTMWGAACSTQTTMTSGTIDDIVKQAKEMIKICAPGGGFVFSQIHNIQPNISPEKILALFDTALKYGNSDFYRR